MDLKQPYMNRNHYAMRVQAYKAVRVKRLVLYVVLAISIASCSKEQNMIPIVRFYPGSTSRISQAYMAPQSDTLLRDGLFCDFWQNSVISTLIRYRHGVPDGDFWTFYETGQLESRGSYASGELDGILESYFENGKLESKVEYKSGKTWRIHNVYDSSGHSLDYGNLSEGNGWVKAYRPDGSLKLEGMYVDGYQEGTWVLYALRGLGSVSIKYERGKVILPKFRREGNY